jgi:hypothetical protein
MKSNKHSIWKAWQFQPIGGAAFSPSVDWTVLQDRVMNAKGDVLFILDCCYAASMVHKSHTGGRELLLASGKTDRASNQNTFTKALIREIKELQGQPCTVKMLHHLLLEHQSQHNLDPSPLFDCMSETQSGIVLASLEKDSATTSLALKQSTIKSLSNPQCRVLISLSLTNLEKKPISEVWLEWFKKYAPPEIAGVDIALLVTPEAAYEANSSLLLVTMPTALWNTLPHHPAICFVSEVRSNNLLTTSHHVPKASQILEKGLKGQELRSPSIMRQSFVERNREIPEYRTKLIICIDDVPSDRTARSNVARMARAIKPRDKSGNSQIAYYGNFPQTWVNDLQLTSGPDFTEMSEAVCSAYRFLAINFTRDTGHAFTSDTIFLIAYSRGAAAARCLAAFLKDFGLLNKEALPWLEDFFSDWASAGREKTSNFFSRVHSKDIRMFNGVYLPESEVIAIDDSMRDAATAPAASVASKQQLTAKYLNEYRNLLQVMNLTQTSIRIECMGLFDSIVPRMATHIVHGGRYAWPKVTDTCCSGWASEPYGDHIENVYHALALDERRYTYSPALLWRTEQSSLRLLKQVWFPGMHEDVGGYAHDNSIGNIPLAWMFDQLSGADPRWIYFDHDVINNALALPSFGSTKNSSVKSNAKFSKHTPVLRTNAIAGAPIHERQTLSQVFEGRHHRRPGSLSNDRFLYQSGKTSLVSPQSFEYVHASVRVRIGLFGAAPKTDWRDAFPFRGWDIAPYISIIKDVFHPGMMASKTRLYTPTATGGPLHNWILDDASKTEPNPPLGEDSMDSMDTLVDESHTGNVTRWRYIGHVTNHQREMPEEVPGICQSRLFDQPWTLNESKAMEQRANARNPVQLTWRSYYLAVGITSLVLIDRYLHRTTS